MSISFESISFEEMQVKITHPIQSLCERNEYALSVITSTAYTNYTSYKTDVDNLICIGDNDRLFTREFLYDLKKKYMSEKEFYFKKLGYDGKIPYMLLYLLAYFSKEASHSLGFRSLCVRNVGVIKESEFSEVLIRIYDAMEDDEKNTIATHIIANADSGKEFYEEALDGLMVFTALYKFSDFYDLKMLYKNAMKSV